MKKWFFILLIFSYNLQTNAFEDCIVTSNDKLTDITIEDKEILDAIRFHTIGKIGMSDFEKIIFP